MNVIEDLIERCTSSGVAFKMLGDIAEVRSGWAFPHNHQGITDGKYPFYKVSDMNTSGNELVMLEANNTINQEAVKELGVKLAPVGTVIFPKVGAAVATNKKRLLSIASAYDNNIMGLIPHEEVEPRYLYYWMQTINLSTIAHDSGAVPSIRKSEMEKVRIPLPPLEAQRAVVDILDSFTNLEAALRTELKARKKQLEYYRDELFSFSSDKSVEWVPLGQVGEFIRGRRFTKDDYVEDGIGAIHYGDIYTRYGTATDNVVSHVRSELRPRLRFAKHGDVILTDVGETVEDVGKAVAWLGSEDVAIHDHCYAFRHTMNPKFISYYMQSSKFRSDKAKYVARTKVKTLLIKGLSKVCIPVPSLTEQDRIVSILSNFDLLINSASEGLPAEINMRHKQYEYYREKLLVFREATT
ncbi:MAG TPA: restriction endonuclease subunit S [Candidatus Saccharimonadales bacterium]|nr:restriction endonuclease subunit S [Candidatus Saccharimonadales bacterium]